MKKQEFDERHLGCGFPALGDYIKELIKGVNKAKSKREFKFKRDTAEVASAIKEILIRGEFETNTQTIADVLLDEEKKAQEKIESLGKDIKKGSLLQSFLTIDGKDFFIVTKVYHNSFIDQKDQQKKGGLPFKKKVLKSCLVESENGEIQNVIVFDTQSPISVYWWRDFLGLEELNSDEKNTKTAFDAVDQVLKRKVKPKHPADHTFLRNALLTYFKTQATFEFNEMIKHVIGVLKSEDSDLNLEKLKSQLEKLPEAKKFDRKFNIKPERITARQMKEIIPLHEHIDLTLKSAIIDLKKIIKPWKGDNNEKYILVRSDRGYDKFKSSKKHINESFDVPN